MAVKRWPPRNWVRLAEELAGRALPVLACGAVQGVPALPRMPLRRLAVFFAVVAENEGVVIGGDTGPVRLAEAAGARVVGLFGPTTVDRYGYMDRNVQGLPACPHRKPLAITEQPCWWSAACPLSRDGPACMADIAVSEVLGAVTEALKDPSPACRSLARR